MTEPNERPWFAGGGRGAEAYEHYVGRWSRQVGKTFLDWLSLPASLDWVDVGCGTGALVETILDRNDPSSVIGVEPSEGYLSAARARIQDERSDLKSGNAMSLPLNATSVDVAVSGLVLNFVPDKQGALLEFSRVTRPGGTIALYVWDYAGEMQLMRYFWDAVSKIFPDGGDHDEGKQFPICKPEPLADLFRAISLEAVDVGALDIPTEFVDFNDYWSPFLRGQGPAGSYCVSLSESDRERLRSRLEISLPIRSDGRIHLIARAWGAKGIVPSQ